MTFLVPPPRFQPRLAPSGIGWEILVTWQDDGRTDTVDGFANKRDAKDWIAKESALWEYHRRRS